MNYKISFQEMSKLGSEKISKQPLLTLEQKRKQFQELKKTKFFKKQETEFLIEYINNLITEVLLINVSIRYISMSNTN